MDRLTLLKQLSFGARVAEEETADLASYFVETDQWTRIFRGEIDIIRGEKGAGKSAIYALLVTKTNEFFDKNILLVTAEKPRGTPVFKELIPDPPTEEFEFVGLWKLYILTLIAQTMREFGILGQAAQTVISKLEEQGLLERVFDFNTVLRLVRDYVRNWLKPELEGGITLDPHSGIAKGVSLKIRPSEPSAAQRSEGFISVDNLIRAANTALHQAGFQVWVLLDRLDVAFAETHALERNALRALFRVYRDIGEYEQIKLKIFLRSDIWKKTTETGFREASHITRFAVLDWSPPSLLNLVVRRLLKNRVLVDEFSIDRDAVLRDFKAQSALFFRLFPQQVEQGSRKPGTFDWMISRCADGTGKTAPRELIHLLTSLQEQQIASIERGEGVPEGDQLFDRSVFKTALPVVSEARLTQTLIAEYPDFEPLIMKLSAEKTEQTSDSLALLWRLTPEEAVKWAQRLIEVGFFEARGSKDKPTFWVPFLYRDALNMSQGFAEE